MIERKPYGLTAQELKVMKLLCEGMSNKEMAARFAIKICTVTRHLQNLCDKTGCGNRLELALFAVKKGLVVLDGRMETREALLTELEAVHRKIERYVERSRVLIQQL